MEAFANEKIPLQVAVMGCVVNGPGEARDADLGIAAGRGRGHLFVKGKNVEVVKEDEMVEALVAWAKIIHAEGAEAALEKIDTKLAEREALLDREELLREQGEDVNEIEQKLGAIRNQRA